MKRIPQPPATIQNLFDIAARKKVDGTWFAANVPTRTLTGFVAAWDFWRRPGQGEPAGDWDVWLMLAGRGFGKTRTGAEWLRSWAELGDEHTRLALVGATANDVRTVMVEGDSGILRTSTDGWRPQWEPTLGRLIWPNGAQAYVYSAESPDRLRGPQFCAAWCDELAAWPHATAAATWDNLRFALRIGHRPRLAATTTPRPTAFVRAIVALPGTVVTGGRTADNALLAKSFLDSMNATYAGTALGRQELDGELIEDRVGALWTSATLEGCRCAAAPPLKRVVVGVDPSASVGGDACGIVVVGLGEDDIGYVLEDATVAGVTPEGWANVVKQMSAKHSADLVVAEVNNGGDMVASVLHAADDNLPLKQVRAAHNKTARAEPVQTLYARGRIRHVGPFDKLEAEMCGLLTAGGYVGPGRSPDRADALVWALTELMLGDKAPEPRVRVV